MYCRLRPFMHTLEVKASLTKSSKLKNLREVRLKSAFWTTASYGKCGVDHIGCQWGVARAR